MTAIYPSNSPTELLLRANVDLLSPAMIYRQISEGLALQDVEAMLSIAAPGVACKILCCILGKPIQTVGRKRKLLAQLSAHEGAVAFQFAKALEQALIVFGSQQLVEEWLCRSCLFLDGGIPMEMLQNALGFQLIQTYLRRIEYGIYQ
jgi:putative toxin-antitoxin system antitoxin component (TIGR02293 family)